MEKFDSTLQFVKINLVKYNDSDVETNASFCPNGDTAKACFVGTGECNIPLGVLKTFRIEVNRKYFSKSYIVMSAKANVFDIYINTLHPLHLYSKQEDVRLQIVNSFELKLFDRKVKQPALYVRVKK